MESEFLEIIPIGILVVAFAGLAAVLGYRIGARKRRAKPAAPQTQPSLRLRPEVTARMDRSRSRAVLTLENVGGVDAFEVSFQAGWELGRQEVDALADTEKYRLPLPVLPVGKSEIFDLKSYPSRSPRLFLRLSWKNRAGRVDKRSLALTV